MTRICFILVFCVLVGCQSYPYFEHGQARCGNCRRVVYDGDFRVERNGFKGPVGPINHCQPWDINCVSKFRDDSEHKSHWGYEHGRKDALEFHYEKEMDPKTHHAAYIEGYKKGYKEVIDVRALPNKED